MSEKEFGLSCSCDEWAAMGTVRLYDLNRTVQEHKLCDACLELKREYEAQGTENPIIWPGLVRRLRHDGPTDDDFEVEN